MYHINSKVEQNAQTYGTAVHSKHTGIESLAPHSPPSSLDTSAKVKHVLFKEGVWPFSLTAVFQET